MKYIYTILVSATVTLLTLLGAYNFLPISIFDPLVSEKTLGTSLTTIQGTDTIKSSRTTINNNFTALNTGKIEVSTTSLPLITTLSGLTTAGALATVGTITSGVWSGSTINVNKGGTGATSFTQYRLLVGSSTNALSITAAGTDGQLLTYSSSSAPYWASPAVDTTVNYSWSGTHSFSSTTSFTVFPTTPNSYPTGSTSVANKGYADYVAYATTTGATTTDFFQAFSPTESQSTSASYVKGQDVELYVSGSVSTQYALNSSGGESVCGKVYVNDVAYGTENCTTATALTFYSQNVFGLNPGDNVQLYIKVTGGTVTSRLFKIYWVWGKVIQ